MELYTRFKRKTEDSGIKKVDNLKDFPHPLFKAKTIQTVRWTAFKLKTEYELEFVNFLKAPTKPYGDGAYTQFCAISLHDYEQPLVMKGDFFNMSISYKEFVIALEELHPFIRKPLNEIGDNNVVIKFIKTSIKAMKILSILAKETTPELKARADEEYNLISNKEGDFE